MSDSLWPCGLYSPWNSPGWNTGVGSLSLLQGIFPTQGSSPGLLHCRWILYPLSHQGSPRILEWVAFPFSSRSSRPRNLTGVSCTAGGFFTSWATREAPLSLEPLLSDPEEVAGEELDVEPLWSPHGAGGLARGTSPLWTADPPLTPVRR